MKHKHYDMIVAWANGARLEYSLDDKEWITVQNNSSPTWAEHVRYRIAPNTIWVNGIKCVVPTCGPWSVLISVGNDKGERLASRKLDFENKAIAIEMYSAVVSPF